MHNAHTRIPAIRYALILASLIMILCLMGCGEDASDGVFDPEVVPVFCGASPALSQRAQELKAVLGCTDEDSFHIDESGRLTYYRQGNTLQDGSLELTDAEAAARGEGFLRNLGLLPEGGYRTRVSRVSRSVVDVMGTGSGEAATVEYTISFYRVFRGVDVVSDAEDGIMLSFDARGITDLRYYWRELEVRTTDVGTGSPITREDAHRIYRELWDVRHGDCCDPCPDPDIREAYLQSGSVTRPCWVVSEDKEYTNAWWIDMYTGEVLAG